MKQPSHEQKEAPWGYWAAKNDMINKAAVLCSLRTRASKAQQGWSELSNAHLQEKDVIKEGDISILIQ